MTYHDCSTGGIQGQPPLSLLKKQTVLNITCLKIESTLEMFISSDLLGKSFMSKHMRSLGHGY